MILQIQFGSYLGFCLVLIFYKKCGWPDVLSLNTSQHGWTAFWTLVTQDVMRFRNVKPVHKGKWKVVLKLEISGFWDIVSSVGELLVICRKLHHRRGGISPTGWQRVWWHVCRSFGCGFRTVTPQYINIWYLIFIQQISWKHQNQQCISLSVCLSVPVKTVVCLCYRQYVDYLFFPSPSSVCRLADSYAVCTANAEWTLRLTMFVTALQPCMNTPSEGAYEPVVKHIHTSKIFSSNQTVYCHVDFMARPVLTSLERLLHCAYLWINIAGTKKVLVYIMNLLISAHIQLVHIWILYVCFLSLCSHRATDIFLIWEIIVDWFFFLFLLENFQ